MSMSAGEDARDRGLWWWRRRRSMALDVGLAALAALEGTVGGWSLAVGRFHLHAGPALLSALIGGAAGASLVVRRRWPALPVVVSMVLVPGLFGIVLLEVALYTLAVTWTWPSRRRTVVTLSAVVFLETTAMMLFLRVFSANGTPPSEPPVPGWVPVLLALLVSVGLTVAPVVTGLYIGARRRLVESLQDRAQGLEAELDLLAERATERARRARLEERTRIAREMHDVVAHRVSLIVVHAGALERIAARDPQKAAQSAKLMADTGRQALNELREILGVLRMNEESAEQTQGLAQLSRLVEQSKAAGMRVTLTVSGDRQRYSGDAEQTAYRVVQEGLTNAHKHAGGARVSVLLAYVPNGVRVAVVNDCPDGGEQVRLPSGGNGLVGMEERVRALGGSFTAGPEHGGGFRVEATLPSRLAVRPDPLR
ncbi:histidine kinase [Kitasatospora sp. RB6PN24]|uniref:sensor histidine kinase n=1 Tax=Kitasatospora humi TaxID=2893891 RepID=UPI001E5B0375|nr:histidine kinase [Kitasatospora humi]MCC9312201.1 histidine kinase [Kitasatospora humi]